jgi:hypothetical protein
MRALSGSAATSKRSDRTNDDCRSRLIHPRRPVVASPRKPRIRLERSGADPPLWPASPGAWHAIVAEVRRLADRWHHAAVSHGWTIEELYPLHAVSPFNRLDQMDAFWVAARRGDQVTAVDHVAITLKTRSGATLRIYRHAPQSRP